MEQRLSYLPAMFATCMLFQSLYLACVVLWLVAPGLGGHQLLTMIFPQFQLLGLGSFLYGLILSGIYGWIVSAIFVFFYNLWPRFAAALTGKATAAQ